MSKAPKYWNTGKKYLSKKDKVMFLLINKDITLSLLDKYFFAVFQYFGFLLMSVSGWYFLFMINFSSKDYKGCKNYK